MGKGGFESSSAQFNNIRYLDGRKLNDRKFTLLQSVSEKICRLLLIY